MPSGGPVEPVLLRFQTLLANALAMLQLVHLIVVKKFHYKFNELALGVPVDSSLRAPNLQEVLAADKSVWIAVTSAMRDNSWSLSDTMSEIAYCQNMQTALQPRPRALHAPVFSVTVFVHSCVLYCLDCFVVFSLCYDSGSQGKTGLTFYCC